MKAMVFAALLTLTAQAAQNNYGVIEGVVTRYGTTDGIANVEVTLALETGQRDRAAASTDSEGRFTIRDVAPGKYTVSASRGGYVNPAPNGVRVREGGSTKTITVGPREQVRDANMSLMRGGVIAGRILKTDGRPVSGLRVSAVPEEQNAENVAVRAETNDRGEYRIFGIEGGKYHVRAEGSAGNWTPTYLPGVAETSGATVLRIGDGSVLTGNDFILIPVRGSFTISGKLVSPKTSLTGYQLPWVRLIPRGGKYREGDLSYNYRRTGSANHLDFEIGNVPSGSYDMFLNLYHPDAIEKRGYAGRVSVDVNGQNVTDLTVIASAIDVEGRFVVEGANVSRIEGAVSLALIPQQIPTSEVKADAKGAFTIPSVLDGAWKVMVSNLPRNLAVYDMLQKDRSIVESGAIVADGAAVPIQVILQPAETLEGLVQNSEQRPTPGAQIVLIPTGANQSRMALYRRATSDAAGRFTFTSVVEGPYAVLAFEPSDTPSDPFPTGSAELRAFLAPYMSRSSSVTVAAGKPANIVVPALRQ